MKKLNKFFAILVSLAMMATLCVCMAFAVDEVPTADIPNKASVTDGKLVKYLVVPDGVKDFPTVKSTFTFTGVDGTGTTATEADKAKPAPAEITINSSSTNSEADDGISKVGNVAIPGLDLTKIDHPGVYVYTVEESACEILNPEAATGTLTKDGAKYTVRYSVVREGDGYTIKYVTVTKYNEETKQTTTITDPTKDYDPGTEGVQNDGGFSFKNTYKLNQSGTTYDDAALKVTKDIAHEKEAGDNTKFPMTITLTKAVGLDDGATEENPTPVPSYRIYDVNTKQAKSQADIPFPYGTDTIQLADDEAIVFLTLPVGTKYTVSETLNNAADYSAYAPSATVNGANEVTENLGQTLPASASALLIEEDDKDVVAYVNDYNKDIDTPTGILINNLPYIALALVAIGGLVAYVVVRRRQDEEA